jgi:hypothetical protein
MELQYRLGFFLPDSDLLDRPTWIEEHRKQGLIEAPPLTPSHLHGVELPIRVLVLEVELEAFALLLLSLAICFVLLPLQALQFLAQTEATVLLLLLRPLLHGRLASE